MNTNQNPPTPYAEHYATWGEPPAPPTPKKKRRIFLWFFLAAQVLFLIWIIAGTASHPHVTAASCGSLDLQTCQSASNAGTAIGVGLLIGLWVAFDVIVGGTYAIYRLVKRP